MPENRIIRRRYIVVGDRVVHYRRAGSGPPIVIIHPSPSSSAAVVPLVERLSSRFTVFALDTPGFGESDALPRQDIEMRHLASALAETLDALAIPKCAILGLATGACIALEFGCRNPERVRGLVLDLLPIMPPDERRDVLANYFPPFRPRWDGSHLTSAWTRNRDHQVWFPWYRRKVAARDARIATPEQLHQRIMDFFRSGDHYRFGYRAAFLYDPVAAVKKLTAKATFLGQEGNILYPHLDRLPPTKPGQSVLRLPPGGEVRLRAIEDLLARYAKGKAPAEPERTQIVGRINRHYVDAPHGQILVRSVDSPRGRPLLLLHDCPGSSAMLEPFMRIMARDRPVLAFDLPGNGDSDPFSGPVPTVADYTASARRVIAALGFSDFDLYGRGSGAVIAAELAGTESGVRRLILENLMIPTKGRRRELAANLTPSIDINWDGSHLYSTWLMLRDHQLFFPWYNRTADTRLGVDADFSARHLHDWTLEVLKSRTTYHHTTQAVLRHDLRDKLTHVAQPTLVSMVAPSRFERDALKIRHLLRNADIAVVPNKDSGRRPLFSNFLDAP